MDIRQLRYFVAIAERGSFSAAASALNVAQSALSRHMALLEHEFGGPLVERGTRGISVSEAGKILLDRARFILAEVENTRAEVASHNRELGGRVRLAAPSTLADVLYCPLAQHLTDAYPRLQLQLSEGLNEEVTDRLLLGALDLAIVTEPQPNEHLGFEPLFTEPVFLLGQPDDPLLAERPLPIDRIFKRPFVLPMGAAWRPRVRRQTYELSGSIQVDSFTPLKQLVRAGLGYGLLPFSGVHQELRDGTLAAAELVGFRAHRVLAIPKGRPTSRATRAVIKALHDVTQRLIGEGQLRVIAPPLPAQAASRRNRRRPDRKSVV